MKLGRDTGSVVNWMYGGAVKHPKNQPEVGAGATELQWTDRHAFTVIEVSPDKKRCKIRRCKAVRTDNHGMSDSQSYNYIEDPNGHVVELFFKWGAWREHKPDAYEIKWPKFNVVFGRRDEHYDYSF